MQNACRVIVIDSRQHDPDTGYLRIFHRDSDSFKQKRQDALYHKATAVSPRAVAERFAVHAALLAEE